MTNRVNPYTRLLSEIKEHCRKVKFRHTKVMWLYAKEKLGERWVLTDLYERVAAAEQLGYDVQLSADDDGLRVTYVKKVPEAPHEWRF